MRYSHLVTDTSFCHSGVMPQQHHVMPQQHNVIPQQHQVLQLEGSRSYLKNMLEAPTGKAQL